MQQPGHNLNTLIRAFLVLCIGFFVSLESITSTFALPASVDITLGASQKPVSELFVFGPLQICGSKTISVGEGRYLLKLQNGCLELSSSKIVFERAKQIALKGLRNGYLKIERGRAIRAYSGLVLISIAHDEGSHLMLVNRVRRADYIAGVCAAEMPKGAGLEAIKAQAVLANNIIARMGAHASVDDTTQNAAYMGVVSDRPELKIAVRAIGDETLFYKGHPIQSYFHSTCAGRTSRGCDIFGIDARTYAYLESVECHYCKKSPFWKHTVSAVRWTDYVKKFGASEPAVDKKDEAGRALKVSRGIVGSTKLGDRVVVLAYDFWTKLGQNFGWNIAPGNIFTLRKKGDYLEVDSRGGGHGVGMCQFGAMGLAVEGKTYVEILHHYFPQAKLSKK